MPGVSAKDSAKASMNVSAVSWNRSVGSSPPAGVEIVTATVAVVVGPLSPTQPDVALSTASKHIGQPAVAAELRDDRQIVSGESCVSACEIHALWAAAESLPAWCWTCHASTPPPLQSAACCLRAGSDADAGSLRRCRHRRRQRDCCDVRCLQLDAAVVLLLGV